MNNDTAMPLQRSEQDFAGTNAKIQMALLYVSGFRDQDATLRAALQLLRRKYRLIEHIVATVVRPHYDSTHVLYARRCICRNRKQLEAIVRLL